MPILAAFIGSLMSALVGFFSSFIAKRVAIILAALTLFGTITATMVAGIDGLISGIAIAVPNNIQIGASWIMPSNFSTCVGAVVTGHLIRWVYDWNTRIIQYKLL